MYDIWLTFVLICYTNFPEFFLGRNPPFLFTPFLNSPRICTCILLAKWNVDQLIYLGWSEYRNGIHDSLSLYNYHFFIVIIWPLELFYKPSISCDESKMTIIARPPSWFFINFFLGGGGGRTPHSFHFLLYVTTTREHWYCSFKLLVSLQTVPLKTGNFRKHLWHNAKLVPGKTFGNIYKISRSIDKN